MQKRKKKEFVILPAAVFLATLIFEVGSFIFEMVSSDEANNTKGIDPSVGGLVWVRRRNGSWWPGRIMGLNELSESCLVSPRSGTPVKLLGREDASIDWYNLEKSKRVKAFRCGEYDDCIEKAKASLANSSKKVVKYARREDAILHALELEGARLDKDESEFTSQMYISEGEDHMLAQESPPLPDNSDELEEEEEEEEKVGSGNVSDSRNSPDSAPELPQSVISFEDPNHIGSNKVGQLGQGRRRTPNDSEDDGTEGFKRMKGLGDLGKGRHGGGLLELVQQENASLCGSNANNNGSNGNPGNGIKVYSSSLKRKRSQLPNFNEILKRKNRRRPLTKVLESTVMVSVPVICDEQVPDSCGSPLSNGKLSVSQSNELKKSVSVVSNKNENLEINGVSCENGATSLDASEASDFSVDVKEKETSGMSGLAENDSSDRLFDVPFVGDEKQSAGRSHVRVFKRQSSRRSKAEAISSKTSSPNESGSTTSLLVRNDNDVSQRIQKGTSKWQLKGKRNSRHITRKQDPKKSSSMSDQKKIDSNSNSTSLANPEKVPGKLEDQRKPSGMRGQGQKPLPDDSLKPHRLLPYRQSRFSVHSRYKSPGFHVRNDNRNNDSLYDVKLEVKASYRPHHVPLVSLMSKLNGKAIIGHPLTVEVLNDGYVLLSGIEPDLKQHILLINSSKGKKLGQLSKKIRKLSSLTGHKKCGEDKGKQKQQKIVVEKARGPVIACVPLKVVFSRINKAVNGIGNNKNSGL